MKYTAEANTGKVEQSVHKLIYLKISVNRMIWISKTEWLRNRKLKQNGNLEI